MLKHRVLPLVLLTGYNVVKSSQFATYRTLGNPITVCRIYESRGVDELILLDIRATIENRDPNLDIIRDISGECFMPLTIGGGIRTVEQARKILRAGADKIAINSAAASQPELISGIAREFGSQCCVVSIDVKKTGDHTYAVFTHGGKQHTGLDPVQFAQLAEQHGAGEILINSIDRDGTMQGYDIDLIKRITDVLHIPVIAAGGAGTADHFVELHQQTGVSAMAAASMFHFTSATPMQVKQAMDQAGIPVRLS